MIEAHADDADARMIPPRDKPGEEIQVTIWATNGCRIQDAFDLEWIARFRLHDLAKTLQLKATHRAPFSRTLVCRTPPTHARIASITRFVSFESLTWIDSTPASFAG